MVTSSRPLRAFFTFAFMALSLASTVAAQDRPTGAPSNVPSDVMKPTAISILNINPLARPTIEKTNIAQDSLFDFTQPRMMKPIGLVPSSDRNVGLAAVGVNRTASGAIRITLEEAQLRAVSTHALVAASAGVDAAHQHHKAVQADYFPKVDAFFANVHFNKFMGDTIQIVPRRLPIAPVARAVPLFEKDQTWVGATVTQYVTPLFKVREAVRIARADERIARAKANAASVQLVADVERVYFELLIAQRRQAEAEANVEIAERRLQIASVGAPPVAGMMEREAALLEAKKTLLAASDKVTESTNSLTDLTGLPEDERLELVPPPPVVIEAGSSTQAPQKPRPVIALNPEIVEAEETVVKAKAAHRLAKFEYAPTVVITGGYVFQTAVPLLPPDFSYIGVIGYYTLFDFGKRERTIKERSAQVTMARANLEMVRAKAGAGARKTVMDVDRTRRILELTRQVVSMQWAVTPRDKDPGPEARAALAKAEAEMFQADLDYRAACAQLRRAEGEQ